MASSVATFCGDYVRSAHDGVVLYAGRSYEPYLGHDAPTDALLRAAQEEEADQKALAIVVASSVTATAIAACTRTSARRDVDAGQVVKAGDLLGLEGATGHATGCHLHYGLIRMDGAYVPTASRADQEMALPRADPRAHRPAARLQPLRCPGAARGARPTTARGLTRASVRPRRCSLRSARGR